MGWPLRTVVWAKACPIPWEPWGTMNCCPGPPGSAPILDCFLDFPCSHLPWAGTALSPCSLSTKCVKHLFTCFSCLARGFRWLFLSGSSPEVSFDLQRGRHNRKMMRDARRLSASDSLCQGGKKALLKQHKDAAENCASCQCLDGGLPFLWMELERNKNSMSQKQIPPGPFYT